MMIKQHFNPEGLQLVLQQLYALSEPELILASVSIAADFKSWIILHFILINTQLLFLETLDQRFMEHAAANVSHFARHRLPIVLTRENTSAADGDDDEKPRGKVLESTRSDKRFAGTSGYYEDGSILTFAISYPIII